MEDKADQIIRCMRFGGYVESADEETMEMVAERILAMKAYAEMKEPTRRRAG